MVFQLAGAPGTGVVGETWLHERQCYSVVHLAKFKMDYPSPYRIPHVPQAILPINLAQTVCIPAHTVFT